MIGKYEFQHPCTPVTAAVCGTGEGDAKLYSANMTSGDAAQDPATGTVLFPGQALLTEAKTIGRGIWIVITSQSGNQATANL